MSKYAHNGQKYVELFSPTNQEILKTWKVLSGVKKVYDERIKTYVYVLKGKAPVPLMHWPKDKTNVAFDQPILVFQIYFAVGATILFDIRVSCQNSLRKRITLSTTQKTTSATLLSVILPLSVKNAGAWSHLLVDMEDVVSSVWKRDSFRSIDSICLGGTCSIRKIFTLSRDMVHQQEAQFIKYDQMPKQMLLSRNDSPIYTTLPCLDGCQKEEGTSLTPSFASQLSSTPSSSKSSAGHFKVSKRETTYGRRAIPKSAKSSGSIISQTLSNKSDYSFYNDNVRSKDSTDDRLNAERILPFLSSLSFADALTECSSSAAEVQSNQDSGMFNHGRSEMSGSTLAKSKYSFYHEDVRSKTNFEEREDRVNAENILSRLSFTDNSGVTEVQLDQDSGLIDHKNLEGSRNTIIAELPSELNSDSPIEEIS